MRLERAATIPAAIAAMALLVLASRPSPAGDRVASPQGIPGSQLPKLAVFLVVDQMRADYVDRFRGDWTQGFKRLLDQGAWFSRAAYPYFSTVTCAGHATVSTGAFPRTHGIAQNTWYDRATGRQVTCTEDSTVKGIGYGVRAEVGDSSHQLLLPTFADEMRARRNARVVTLSLKARSAIMLAGRAGDAVTWLTPAFDGWQTSSAYTPAPVAAVQRIVSASPIAADYGKVWTQLFPVSRYLDPDAMDGENPPRGWTSSFPHLLTSSGGVPDQQFYEQWQTSPFANDNLGRFAGALVESFQLGNHQGTDVLGVSFSTPDLVGHSFGPRSREMQDVYARLDQTIGTLLNTLDAAVGRSQYVLALTSDHGVAAIPEPLGRAEATSGRVSAAKLRDVIDDAARAAAGPGRYVARNASVANEVYFEPGMYETLLARPGALDSVIKTIDDQPGIARVFRREQLGNGAGSADLLLRAAALSYVPQRSGDLLLALEPGWTFAALGTSHGTANPYDQHVPIILMGPGIAAGEYREPATPADIAPTLAALSGITLLRAEGHVLRSALVAPPVARTGQSGTPAP